MSPYKPYIAQASELHGVMNPKGIINARYLNLVKSLKNGDRPDNVKQALFDWLTEKQFTQANLVHLLELEPDEAINTIIQKIGGGLRRESLPEQVIVTLRKALAYLAKETRQRRGHEIGQEIARMRQIKKKYTPEGLVAYLIGA